MAIARLENLFHENVIESLKTSKFYLLEKVPYSTSIIIPIEFISMLTFLCVK